jgi:hypothetical protein
VTAIFEPARGTARQKHLRDVTAIFEPARGTARQKHLRDVTAIFEPSGPIAITFSVLCPCSTPKPARD